MAATKATRTKTSAAKTRLVRIQLDYVIEMREATDSLPSLLADISINDVISFGMAPMDPEEKTLVNILPGAHLSASLDYRANR